MADVRFEIVRVLTPTTGNTVDATISGFGTPAAALFFLTNAQSNDVVAGAARMSIGFKQGDSNQWCVGTFISNAATVAFNRRSQTDDAVAQILDPTGVAVEYTAARITDGYRISGTTAGAAYLLTVVLIGGSDVADAYVGNFNLGTTTGVQSITAPGFEPDLVFGSSANANAVPPSSEATVTQAFGVAYNGGTIEQAHTQVYDVGGADPMQSGGYYSNSRFLSQCFNNVVSWLLNVTAFGASGFSVQQSASSSGDYFGYLALRFTNSPDIKVVQATIPTSGNYAQSDVGFTPNFGMLGLVVGPTSAGTLATSNTFSQAFTAFDETSVFTSNVNSEDGIGTSQANSLAADSLRIMQWDDTADAVQSSSYSFDSDGWDFTLSTNPASAILGWGLAIGPGAGGSTTVSPSPLQSLSNQYAVIAATKLNGVLQ